MSEHDDNAEKVEHSPTPFYYVDDTLFGIATIYAHKTDEERRVAEVDHEDGVKRAADTAFIVRACNSHDSLMSLVSELADALEYAASYKGAYLREKHGDDILVDRARAALQKATGAK
jgi:hypothetical protein